MTNFLKADIVIVNWNSGEQLRDCVESVRAHGRELVGSCIVVDNGSTDGSTDFLFGAADVDLILTGKNLGFGVACNLGASRGGSPLVLFLNPDASLKKDSLAYSVTFLQALANRQVGIVGVSLVGEDGKVQRTCARAPTPLNLIAKSLGFAALFPKANFQMMEWDHAETRVVDQVIGAFFCVRRALFEKLGGFDERFFVYFEEVDFSRRAAANGFTSIYLADARAFHKGGGVTEQVKAKRLFYSLRSRIQYAFKHFSPVAAMLVAVVALAIEPVLRLMILVVRWRLKDIVDLANGYRMLCAWVYNALVAKLFHQKT